MPKIPWQQLISQEYAESYPQEYAQGSLSLGQPIIGLAIPSKGPGTKPITTCTVTNTGNGPISFDIGASHYPKGTPVGGQYTRVDTALIPSVLAAGASMPFTLVVPVGVDSNWVNGDWKTTVNCYVPGTSTLIAGGTATLDPSFTVTVVTGVSITALVVT